MYRVPMHRHGWVGGQLKVETVKVKPQGAKKSPVTPNFPVLE